MQDAVAFFAMRLIAGIACICYLLAEDERRVVSPYFRIQMLLLLGLAVLCGLVSPAGERFWGGTIALSAFGGSMLWMLERRRGGRLAFVVIHLVALIWLSRAIHSVPRETLASPILMGVSTLASAGTLGTMMSGMLLGHRYLTSPGMPLQPLTWVNSVVGVATLLRLVASAGALFIGMSVLTQSTYIVWLSLRWLAGIVGPLVVWHMVHRILVFRNTQSATGVLFVGVVLTFIGELTGDVLFRVVGVPF